MNITRVSFWELSLEQKIEVIHMAVDAGLIDADSAAWIDPDSAAWNDHIDCTIRIHLRDGVVYFVEKRLGF